MKVPVDQDQQMQSRIISYQAEERRIAVGSGGGEFYACWVTSHRNRILHAFVFKNVQMTGSI